jgi:DNA-binding NtrC family response regulator
MKKKIIIIDDDSLILRSIEKQLNKENFEIELINDPCIGLKKLENEEYSLLICDIRMKPITGLELLRSIKETHPDIPVIIMTGFIDDGIMEKAKEIGYNDYLIKPFRKKSLTDSINRIFNFNFT